LLRGVDGQLLPGVQVPSALRAVTYVLPPGAHVLWVSSAPAGIPFVPEQIRCFIIDAMFVPGSAYVLREDPKREVAILFRAGDEEPLATGRLVDNPLAMERKCRWR
jgi:hypothetical protein